MTLRVEVSGTETITYTQAWNAENRLSVVTNTVSGAVTRFVYDGDGNRVLREQPDGSVTAYLGVVEVTLSGTERLTTSYYFAGAQRIAMREGVTLTYLHGDHLGSASLATDEGGAQVSAMRYTPFGETRYGDTPTDFRFTGQREEGFGLYDYGARFYSPGLGRFVSADVIVPEVGNPQSLNRYVYVLNNPLRYTDPTGHLPSFNGIIDWVKRGLSYWALTVDAPAVTEYPATGERTPLPESADDLTTWLIDQMNTNAQSQVVALMQGYWRSQTPQGMAGSLAAWNSLVRGGAIWDFKSDIRDAGYDQEYPNNFKIGGETFRYDAFANIHYGFVGRAAGFPEPLLTLGAGAAQWRQWHISNPALVGPWDTFLDQPYDNWCVMLGSYLYDYMIAHELDALTLNAFEQALQDFISIYGTAQSWEENNSSLP